MPKPITNQQLFNRCYATTQEAADRLAMLDSHEADLTACLTVTEITHLRNAFRYGLASAQELKNRVKTPKNDFDAATGQPEALKHRPSFRQNTERRPKGTR